MPEKLHRDLGSWGGAPAREWLASLPSTVAAIAAAWSLELGEPYEPGGSLSWVAPATRADGTLAVLKVAWPHDEGRDEAAGLRVWDGAGAVRLLEHDADRWALLLERCDATHHLGRGWRDDTVEIGISVLRALWRPVDVDHPFEDVASMTARWATVTRERAARVTVLDRAIVDVGVRLLELLPHTGERYLLHQDLHPENVLRAGERWVAIDPKPVVGDRGFDTVQLVTQGVRDRRHQRERLARLEDELGIDRERLRGWALARVVEWTLWEADHTPESGWAAELAESAALLASA